MLFSVPKESVDLKVRHNVAAWVRYKMRRRRMSQTALAELMGVAPGTVSRIVGERRTAGLDFFLRFSKEFNVPHEALAYTEPPKRVETGVETETNG